MRLFYNWQLATSPDVPIFLGARPGWSLAYKYLPRKSIMAEPRPNHLINATSPYLQQHAYNPVDWYPWGDEALEKSKRENKPILLSVGYSACHWCHVMERES